MEPPATEALIELVEADVPRSDLPAPVPILEHVSWRIDPGQFWAVGGLPGSGKTDLLCTAAGLVKPIQGTHRLFGANVSGLQEQELIEKRLRVGIVFSGGRLFPHLTVAQNIALPIRYHSNWPEERAADEVKAALALTGLERLADRLPSRLTRNLHQRVGLARALALQPEALLIDNPLAGVDPRQGRWWIDFLCRLTEGLPALGKKLTVVVAVDDLRAWLDTAREFAVIEEKSLRFLGESAAVRESPNAVVQELLTPAFEE